MRERIFWSIGVIFLALAFDGAILLIVASVFDATVSASIALILLFFTLWSLRIRMLRRRSRGQMELREVL